MLEIFKFIPFLLRQYGGLLGLNKDLKNAYAPMMMLLQVSLIISYPFAIFFNVFPFGIEALPDWDLRFINMLLIFVLFLMFILAGANLSNWVKLGIIPFFLSGIDKKRDFESYSEQMVEIAGKLLIFMFGMLFIMGTWPFRDYPGSLINFLAASIIYLLLSAVTKINTSGLEWIFKRYVMVVGIGGGLMAPILAGYGYAYVIKLEKYFDYNFSEVLMLTPSDKAEAAIKKVEKALREQDYNDLILEMNIYVKKINSGKRLHREERKHFNALKKKKSALDKKYALYLKAKRKIKEHNKVSKQKKPEQKKIAHVPEWKMINSGILTGKGFKYSNGRDEKLLLVAKKKDLRNGDIIVFESIAKNSSYSVPWANFTQGDIRSGQYQHRISRIENWLEDGVYSRVKKGGKVYFRHFRKL